MQLVFNSALLAYAGAFTGQWAGDRGIEVAPLRPGRLDSGVTVAAFNRGAVGMIGYDPKGSASERVILVPGGDLLKAARGIKTAERDVRIEGDDPAALKARVTTYYKEHATFLDFQVRASSEPLDSYRAAVDAALQRWGRLPELSSNAGRYDIKLLLAAIKAMVDDTDSLVISGYDGGPLRLQREDAEIVVLLMPQAAQPIPSAPDWLSLYAQAR